MRIVPKRWHNETWICSMRGHVAPAAAAVRMRPEDANYGFDEENGTRLSRCFRCDMWLRTPPPAPEDAAYEVVPPIAELDLPRRGRPLQDAIIMRLIAIDRGIHGVLFSLAAIAVLIIELQLPRIKDWAQSLLDDLNGTIDNTAHSHSVMQRQLEKLLNLHEGEVKLILFLLIAYATIESVEAVFLWKEKRWAEYLTVVATAGFLPLEIRELTERVSFLRVAGLVVNIAILVYLVYAKRLFGVRGGAKALEEQIDWDEILASPVSPEHTPVTA